MTNLIKLKNVRILYPCLFEKNTKYEKDEAKAQYTAKIVIPKMNTCQDDQYEQAINQMQKIIETSKSKLNGGESFLKDIDDLRNGKNGHKYNFDFYNNTYVITAKNRKKPHVIDNYKEKDQDGNESFVHIIDENKIRGGDLVNVWISTKEYTEGGGGISARLQVVQFVKSEDTEALFNQISLDELDFDFVEVKNQNRSDMLDIEF